MSRHIQAYFKSEDDAEGARTNLIPLNLEQVEVGRLDDTLGVDGNLLAPLFPIQTGGMVTGSIAVPASYSGTSSLAGVVPAASTEDRNQDHIESGDSDESDRSYNATEDGGNLRYVLSAKVEDDQYEHLVDMLRKQGAYISKGE